MRIAICDDDILEIARIASLLDVYRKERNIRLTYKAYQSAVELLSNAKSGMYDLVLLDIFMPGFTGIQAAHEMRGFDGGVKIVFLTSSPEFALESYAVRARDYILKPVSNERLFSVLDSIFAEEETPLDSLSIKTSRGMARFLFSKLVFVEVMNKRLYFHLSDGSTREVFAPLSEYEARLLLRTEFIKVHRSYIVNLWHMSELTASSFITYGGSAIPISRLLYSEVRRAYMEHLFTENRDKT